MNSRKYIEKTGGSYLYVWTPECEKVTSNVLKSRRKNTTNNFCNAVAHSNGDDFITTYSYDLSYDNRQKESRDAYVECGYVE